MPRLRVGLPFVSPWKLHLVVHLAAWAAFVGVTKILLGGEAGPAGRAGVVTAVWAALALVTMLSWALAILPARGWVQWISDSRQTLLVGTPIGIAAWAAALFTGKLGWGFVGEMTLTLVHRLLTLVYADVVFDAPDAVIGTSRFEVGVNMECAGYQGIGLIGVFLLGFLCLSRKQLRFPQSLVLLPMGILLIWTANVLRIVLLIAIGTAGWPQVARGGFHSQAGWLAFNAIALGLVAIAGQVRWFAKQAPRPLAVGRDPTTAYLLPFLGIVATAMITGALSDGFDRLYAARVLVAAGLLAYFWPVYREVRWSWSWQPLALGAAAFVVWLALVPADRSAGPPSELASLGTGWAAVWLGLRTFGYLVTAPIAEELAFRGFLMRRFASARFEDVPLNRIHWLGFCGSSLLFGLMHGAMWLPATAAGMLFALAALRRGNLLDAVVAHSTTNGLVALYVFSTGAWYLWG